MINAFEGIKIVKMFDPFAADETSEGTGVCVEGFQNCLIVVYLGIGLTLAAGVYYTISFEECDDNATWTHIADADICGGLAHSRVVNATTEDEQLIVRGYKGNKKYVRAVATLTGTDTTDTTMAMFVVLANPLHIPITPETETA